MDYFDHRFTVHGKDCTVRTHGLSDHISSVMHQFGNFYESEMLDYVASHYPKQRTMLDIGANVGVHAAYYEHFIQHKRLICFEPFPANIKILKHNTHSPTEIIEKALGDVPGTVPIGPLEEHNFGSVSAMPGNSAVATVEMITLDSLGLADVTFIKLDVEGYELKVLRGGVETLKRCHPVLFIEAKKWEDLKPLVNFLCPLGYKVGRKIPSICIDSYEFVYHGLDKRDDLPYLLNEMGLTNRGAEVGVSLGGFSETVRHAWKGQYYLVDRWKLDYDYQDGCTLTNADFETYYQHVASKFASDKRCVIIRNDSVAAASLFPDGHFDWIYIDADHSYEGCKRDIEAWYPKVRSGGLFAGHDYVDGFFPQQGTFGVKSAVDGFIADKDVFLMVSQEADFPTWYFVKP